MALGFASLGNVSSRAKRGICFTHVVKSRSLASLGMTKNYLFLRANMRALLLGLILPVVAQGQSAPRANDAPVIRVRGAFFALSVADLDASTKWYVEKLGLHITMRVARTDATRARVALLQGGGLTVELIQHDDAVPLRSLRPSRDGAISVHGIVKVGVTVDDFDKTLAALRDRGVDIAYGPYPKRPDQPANVIIRDSDGNLVQILGS